MKNDLNFNRRSIKKGGLIFLSALLLITLVLCCRASAQNKNVALYLTLADFKTHHLSFETDGNSGNNIRLNSLLETGTVVVTHDGKKQVLLKKDLFGYRLGNEDYRFFANSGYKIIDTAWFYIYSQPGLIQQGKGLKPADTYYFSTAPKHLLIPLTIKNLEAAYANNHKFRYSLEAQFRNDDDLLAHDDIINAYKVKYLFEESRN